MHQDFPRDSLIEHILVHIHNQSIIEAWLQPQFNSSSRDRWVNRQRRDIEGMWILVPATHIETHCSIGQTKEGWNTIHNWSRGGMKNLVLDCPGKYPYMTSYTVAPLISTHCIAFLRQLEFIAQTSRFHTHSIYWGREYVTTTNISNHKQQI
jgi:hypothetical protein